MARKSSSLLIVLIFPPSKMGQGPAAFVSLWCQESGTACFETEEGIKGRGGAVTSPPSGQQSLVARLDIKPCSPRRGQLHCLGTPGVSQQGSPREGYVVERLRAACSIQQEQEMTITPARPPARGYTCLLCFSTWLLWDFFFRICQGGFHRWTWELTDC